VKKSYCLVTLHRPGNVDNKETLEGLLRAFKEVSKNFPIIFPVHPRTRERIERFGFLEYIEGTDNKKASNGINLYSPLGYIDFLKLMDGSRLVLTDSGGIQEETTILRVPCLTLRENTERPVTVTEGTNSVVGTDKKKIIDESYDVLNGHFVKSGIPEYWDGKASERIVRVLMEHGY
jgi:UDP-N-acetylglucosamine 2-epimerase (non-hydrolysing)